MAVLGTGVVIQFNTELATADAGAFQAQGANGQMPVNAMPHILGIPGFSTYGSYPGGTTGGMGGGGISIF